MNFTLHYEGPLRSARSGDHTRKPAYTEHVQCLRRHFRFQLEDLWRHTPLNQMRDKFLDPTSPITAVKKLSDWSFSAVVNENNHLISELDIVLLRPVGHGKLVGNGGDIDNRIKTLCDALSIPQENQIPKNDGPKEGESPFHCVLEDDSLITSVRVRTDRLLNPPDGPNGHVSLRIHVTVSCTRATMANLALVL